MSAYLIKTLEMHNTVFQFLIPFVYDLNIQYMYLMMLFFFTALSNKNVKLPNVEFPVQHQRSATVTVSAGFRPHSVPQPPLDEGNKTSVIKEEGASSSSKTSCTSRKRRISESTTDPGRARHSYTVHVCRPLSCSGYFV